MNNTRSPTLDVIQESFEDINLNYNANNNKRISKNRRLHNQSNTPTSIRPLSLNSSNRQSSSSLGSSVSISRMNSINSNASSNISVSSNCSGNRLQLTYSNLSLAQSNSSKDALLLTSSQKFRINQKRKKQLREKLQTSKTDSQLIDDYSDDDDLPDNFPIYDVPFSKSLKHLSDHGYFEFKKPQFIKHIKRLSNTNSNSSNSSPIARASSIFSIASDLSELSLYNSSEENLSNDAKLLTKNEDLKLEETLERIAFLKQFRQLDNNANSTIPIPPVSPIKISNNDTTIPRNSIKSSLTSPSKQYMSVTRQTNLPPKDKFEAHKHVRDYDNLVESQIEKEKQKLKEYQKQKDRLIQQHEKDFKTWVKVLKNYDNAICLPATRELWWRGIPDSIRSQVWSKQCIIKGDDQLNDLIKKCLTESQEIIIDACNYKLMDDSELSKREFEKKCTNERLQLIEFVQILSYRIQFSFPNLMVFQIGQIFEDILQVSLAYELIVPQLGLKFDKFPQRKISLQLINLICVLYSNLKSTEKTLNALISVTSKKLINKLFSSISLPDSSSVPTFAANPAIIGYTLGQQLQIDKLSKTSNTTDPDETITSDSSAHTETETDYKYVQDIQNQFDKFLLTTQPSLYNNFIKQDVNTLRILQSSLPTIFSNLLNFETVERIIDIFLFEGDIFLLRCSLALLKTVNYKLFGDLTEVYSVLNPDFIVLNNTTVSRPHGLSTSEVALPTIVTQDELLKYGQIGQVPTAGNSLHSLSTIISTTSSHSAGSGNGKHTVNNINASNDSPKKKNHEDGFVYLDIGEVDEFISNIRRILRKNHKN